MALVEAQPHTDPQSAPEYTYGSEDHPLWYPGTVWTGDQGLVAYALSSFFLNNRTQSDIPFVVGAIAQGSWNAFGNSEHRTWTLGPIGAGDSIIREPPTQAVFSDAGDYVVGRGVMCRFFAEPETRAVLASSSVNWDLKTRFGYMFKATADAITFDGSGNLISDLGSKVGMEASIQHFKAAWGNDYKYGDGFWRGISSDSVDLCEQLILAFDVVGAWLVVQSDADAGRGMLGWEMRMGITVGMYMGMSMKLMAAIKGSECLYSRTQGVNQYPEDVFWLV